MIDSLSLTLSGTSSILEAQYFPVIELSPQAEYILGLVEFLSFNSIPNTDKHNRNLYVGRRVYKIPTGSYELEDINNYLESELKKDDIVFKLSPNNKTLRCTISCSEEINVEPEDSIGSLLGFSRRVLRPNTVHTSDKPIAILKINSLRIECNITTGAYINGKKSHSIHEFFPRVPPGYKIIEVPSPVIYLPINVHSIQSIQLRIVDQDGKIVNFRGETITIRLHIKRVS